MDRLRLILALPFLLSAPATAQPPASIVRTTEARAEQVRSTLRLTGSVEAPRSSVVAAEVAGMVGELHAREGTEVAAGGALVSLVREPVELRREAAAGQLAEAEAQVKSARLRLERLGELLRSEVVSRQTLDDVRYEVEALEGRVAQLEAEVARLDRDLEKATVRAPFAGVVAEDHVEVGEWVDVGDPVVELLSVDELEVRLEVQERDFDQVAPGSPARVTFEALPGTAVEAAVRAVVPRAHPQARTFPVIVALPNPHRRLAAGMLATVELPVGEARRATVVPKDALVTQGRQRFLYVVEEGSTVRRVEVETGSGAGDWVEVRGEVAPGDRVVTRGNERLVDGAEVRAEPMEASPR